MDNWFSLIASNSELKKDAARELLEVGFVIVTGPVAPTNLAQLAAAYDAAVSVAHPADVSIGSSTTRVHDFVNRGPEFDGLYVYQPVLEGCCRIIGQPFKLSTMLARTLRPCSQAQGLHVDFKRDADGWPAWDKAFHYYSLNQDEFFDYYHNRSNVESTFSMIKRKFGEPLRSKTDVAQVNEALCKILCHNICCVIQSMYELGVEPNFAFGT